MYNLATFFLCSNAAEKCVPGRCSMYQRNCGQNCTELFMHNLIWRLEREGSEQLYMCWVRERARARHWKNKCHENLWLIYGWRRQIAIYGWRRQIAWNCHENLSRKSLYGLAKKECHQFCTGKTWPKNVCCRSLLGLFCADLGDRGFACTGVPISIYLSVCLSNNLHTYVYTYIPIN